MMTGPGTNTYLVGGDGASWAVIDPGPPIDAACRGDPRRGAGTDRWILVTHTHNDHSPATLALKAAHRRDRARPWRRCTANGRTRPSPPT